MNLQFQLPSRALPGMSSTLGERLLLAIFSFAASHGDHGNHCQNPRIVAAPRIKLSFPARLKPRCNIRFPERSRTSFCPFVPRESKTGFAETRLFEFVKRNCNFGLGKGGRQYVQSRLFLNRCLPGWFGTRRSNGKPIASRPRKTLGSATSLQSLLGRTACPSPTWHLTFSPSCW